ncbi:porin [Blochmannia endosymbiont of Camponotus (Colobopsis) obliquus]|uniref:porin n=1 Tax=Blochmannia endosymbiont of Camponotus (Colobopsis) obliquus TaxID=1505597 RepID=UPI00061A8336|nr:porin [Blochmannia endosymbiont of Camponotus (Colobopsis) obliquus]AKC60627.1 outer membrane protein C [Blochmannia endosymbiont of Camponotus (Colobopsis) obliquus]
MKLRYLRVLVSTMIAAGTVSATEIYNKNGNLLDFFGTLNSGYYLSNDDSKNGNYSFVRYGVIGKTQTSDQFIGFGMFEYETGLQYIERSNIKNGCIRLGYAGIKFGDFGYIDYGRNYGILYDVGSWTDVMPEFGGDNSIVDNFLSGRASNVLTYRNTNFFGLLDGFNFALQYQGKNDDIKKVNGYDGVKEANGEGYGVSVIFNLDHGMFASAAYSNSKRTANQQALNANVVRGGEEEGSNTNIISNDDNAEAYSLGLKYDANNFYVAALYGETRHMTPFGDFVVNGGGSNVEKVHAFADKAKNVELVVQYRFDFGLRPSISYLHSKISDIVHNYNSYLKKYIAIGASYNFNENVLTKVNYQINLLKKDDFVQAVQLSTDNILALGISYIF